MTTDYATVDDLVADDLPEQDVTLSTGKTIRLRGLSRQMLFVNGRNTEDPAVVETRNLVSCLVQPVLSEDQVKAFMRRMSAGDGHLISLTIRALSGLAEGADKSPVDEVRD